jgi:hypothetical protein
MGEEGEQESRNWTSDIAAVAVYSVAVFLLMLVWAWPA